MGIQIPPAFFAAGQIELIPHESQLGLVGVQTVCPKPTCTNTNHINNNLSDDTSTVI
jgi:hypothetical protein